MGGDGDMVVFEQFCAAKLPLNDLFGKIGIEREFPEGKKDFLGCDGSVIEMNGKFYDPIVIAKFGVGELKISLQKVTFERDIETVLLHNNGLGVKILMGKCPSNNRKPLGELKFDPIIMYRKRKRMRERGERGEKKLKSSQTLPFHKSTGSFCKKFLLIGVGRSMESTPIMRNRR